MSNSESISFTLKAPNESISKETSNKKSEEPSNILSEKKIVQNSNPRKLAGLLENFDNSKVLIQLNYENLSSSKNSHVIINFFNSVDFQCCVFKPIYV